MLWFNAMLSSLFGEITERCAVHVPVGTKSQLYVNVTKWGLYGNCHDSVPGGTNQSNRMDPRPFQVAKVVGVFTA